MSIVYDFAELDQIQLTLHCNELENELERYSGLQLEEKIFGRIFEDKLLDLSSGVFLIRS